MDRIYKVIGISIALALVVGFALCGIIGIVAENPNNELEAMVIGFGLICVVTSVVCFFKVRNILTVVRAKDKPLSLFDREIRILDRIDNLVTKHGFSFQAWDDRYSKGVWAALGTSENQVDTVRELSSGGDNDMFYATDYVFSANWLPYVIGHTLGEAILALENRLAQLPSDQLNRESDWADLVRDAIESLRDATDGKSYYGDKLPDHLDALPKTFEAALSAKSA
ncbi:hypothetical protein [Solimicrobium silvestre]|uniref:Uncharacterized protein n=1 Tax=Solimicrobium silvestre TaxID=2099400 RepID=A0A2S9H442_9BURK|nr:hypothetical protein [Solimicrobium silvestre]PRC94740.1 hypothetical protein S2091_0743 [Solimicrobium silvestre]